ncbi:hypothetical protein [Hymenobacter canadensis]|uniref:Yip1 domain-containing protein n=1 Tax=Hymenobacter canadensis TaxID=2999067 RepID=A0ABY7LVB2_9BACT|nr:hypothetical protein [Hymenobacter canadensis]WBA44328.1 hypothetical protein O3303_21210 [Hymenobacter canadensis]
MENLDLNKIKKQHGTGLGNLWKLYPKSKLYKGGRWPLILALVLNIGFAFSKTNIVIHLAEIANIATSIYPSLLGFLLGGYTIFIGFGNKDLLLKTTKYVEGEEISFFQALSMLFGLSILLHALTLICAIFIKLSLTINLNVSLETALLLFSVVNYIATFLILFMLFYSLCVIKDVVVNIFGFSQLYHQVLFIERVKKESDHQQGAND